MMAEWDTLCPGCFGDKGNQDVCPRCGYDESERRTPLVLPYRVVLNGQFVVGKVLGKPGGFGITYLGWDINLATLVAIKEYLPRDYAGRDADHASVMAHSREDANLFRFGLEQFLNEARTLARFDHPNVVRVRSFFEQHGTAYLVMDYLQGVNLAEYLASHGGRLTEAQAAEIMLPILDGLQEVHSKGFLHRDIKPQNIYVTASGRPILLDFGAARQAMGERSRSLSVVLTPGFSPYEQYHRRGEQGPWTDIYAFAATYYYLLAGCAPPDAPERVAADELSPLSALVPGISPDLNAAIMQSLALDAGARPQDVFMFRDMLRGKAVPPPPAVPAAPARVAGPVSTPAAPPPLPSVSVPPVSAPLPGAAGAPVYAPPSASSPLPYPLPNPPPYAPPPVTKKSPVGAWIVVVLLIAVAAAAGLFFFGGSDAAKKKSEPAAAPPVRTAPAKQQQPAEKPPQPQPTTPPKATVTDKPSTAPTTPAEAGKPPAEVAPPPSETPTPPRQQPAVRTQPPAEKPATPTPPKRDKGSLW
jgi:serine/threonine protein kinase